MAKDRPSDPGDAFRELVTEWERGFDSFANALMGTENFSRSMNQMQNLQLQMRQLFREFMTDNLTLANMPTRDDVVRIAEAVQALDERMSRIESMLEASTGNMPAGATPPRRRNPPRTKKPPSASKTPDSAGPEAT